MKFDTYRFTAKGEKTDVGIREAFKLPFHRRAGCDSWEMVVKENCQYFFRTNWESWVCAHPLAKGNKKGWLLCCPLNQEADALARLSASQPQELR